MRYSGAGSTAIVVGGWGTGCTVRHYGMPHGTFAQWLFPSTRTLTARRHGSNRGAAEGSIHGSVLGTRVLRTEDPGLLTGQRRYVADLQLEGTVQAVFVRSSVAHGTIRAIHIEDATGMPGVVAVWTAAELGVAPHHGFMKVHDDFARPPLAVDRVRFVGEAIAVVFAETYEQGEDAAGAVWAEIDTLPPIIDPETAFDDDAPLIFPDHGSNEAMIITDRSIVDLDAISDVVVRGRYVNQRMAVAPMEPDCCAAAPTPDGRLRVWPSTQMPHGLHTQLAETFGLDPADVHVTTPQVGGGFGGKAGLHPEYTVVAAAARALGRPVVWVPTRSEDMQTLPHSRGQVQYAEIGCRRDGTFTGLRVRLVGDAGAYPTVGAFLAGRHPPHVARHVCVPCDPVRRCRGTHEHDADGRVPRCRPAGGDGVARTSRRPRRARARDRPDRAARAQPPRRRRVPVQDVDRQHVRLGCVPAAVAHGGGGDRL